MKHVLFALLMMVSVAHAEDNSIDAHTMITVQSYDSHLDVFKVAIEHEATGPNYTTLKFLLAAIESLRGEPRLKARPSLVVGNEYFLNHDLKLLDEDLIDSKYNGH